MATHSEGGWLTSTGGAGTANFYTTRETLSSGVVRTTRRKEMKSGWRWAWGITTLGITEITGVSSDYLTYTYSYEGRTLGENENDSADKAYEIGCDYVKQGKYEEAKQWLDIAYRTCKSGYSRENLFRDERNAAGEKLEKQQQEKAKRKKEEEKQKEQEAAASKAVEKKAKRQNVMKKWQSWKTKAACQEDIRMKCEDRALHRRDKHTVLFCSAEAYQKQSQMEIKDIPDIIQFTEVHENKEENNNDEEMTEIAVEENDDIEGTTLDNIKEIDVKVENLLKLLFQNTGKEINSFQQQAFYMVIYRMLDSVDANDIDLLSLFEAMNNIVAINKMNIHDFFSVATLIILSSRLQKLICISSGDDSLLNELKSTWLHQLLKMKNITHTESDLKKFLNVAAKFDFNFFVIATQKLLRFYTNFADLLEFFVKIQKCPLTNKSKQQFVQLLPDGFSPLHLLAESVIECYFCLKFSNYQSQLSKQLQTLELDSSALTHFKVVAVESKSDQDQVPELAKILAQQFTSLWNFSYIDQLLGLVDKAGKIQSMVKILLHFYDFEGTPQLLKIDELLELLKSCSENTGMKKKIMEKSDRLQRYGTENWIKQVYGILIDRSFPEVEYSLNDEFTKLDIFARLKHSDFDLLQKYMKSARSTVLNNFPNIDKLSKSEILQWSKLVRNDASKVELYEMIAVVNRAVELHSKHLPRDVQNMALLLLLDNMTGNEGGRLLQVNTGEGKTIIVAMFAAIMTLRGHVVDVITSSPELAKPQCNELAPFFHDFFDLAASYVTPDCSDNIRKKAYKANIVYGAAEEFQGDILRDEYSQLGTRSARKFDVAVVDEVDSMLIDGRNHLVMLSSPVPGMENLEAVLATIWNHITMMESHLIEKGGRVYLINSSNRINEDGTMKSDDECIDDATPLENSKLEFIKEQTEYFMRMLLRDKEHLDKESFDMCEDYPEMIIPRHLHEFVLNVQLPRWIESAIFAKYAYKNNQHYVIRNGKIAPVDASNTGIVQANMHISNGIHQFLQIKHGAKLCPETYTTNYISNVAFFRRYGSKLVGLTGTLGSENAQALLRKMYNVDTVILPPFRRKQYRQLRPLFAESKDKWLLTIAQSCIRQLETGRAVLVIAQYLSEVDKLHSALMTHGVKESKIYLYKTEEHSDVVQKELKSGEIIIATNIAGRGTDISVSKDVEKSGGLHVCLTSLPVNERVEVQNFGRTSRTGNRGTGQFVIFSGVDSTLEEMKKARDEIEKNRLLEGEAEMEKVLIKDGIFFEFCSLLKHIRDIFGREGRLQCENNVRAVEERFGLWLKEHEDKLEKKEDFQPFCELIKLELKADTFIKNPYFYVLNGNLALDNKEFDIAIAKYTRAIQLDDCFLSNAYYNRGYCKIIVYLTNSKKTLAKEAVEDFRKAKEIIEGRVERDLFVIQQSAPASEALSEQVQHMLTLYAMQKSAIECAIGKGKDFVKTEIERLKTENKDNADEIKEYIQGLEENKIRHEEGVIGEALQRNMDFSVTLKDIESSVPKHENIELYESEIDTFRNNGNLGSFEAMLIKPIDWGSVIGLALLGIGQIVAGAAIGIFTVGAGAAIGFGMLVEGVTDLITCVIDGIINRDFSWAAWGIQKVVSYSVAIACAGLSALKNAAKVAYHGVKQTASVVTKGMTTAVKAGWKLAAKKIGFELGKGVARKLIVGVADYTMNCTLMPLVESKIKEIIENPMKTMVDNNEDVNVLLDADRRNRNAYYQQQIIQKAEEILHPHTQASNIAMGLVRGLQQIGESVASRKMEGISEAIMLGKIVKALYDLVDDFTQFVEGMKSEIALIAAKHREMTEEQKKQQCQTPTAVEEQVKLDAAQLTHGQLSEKLIQAIASNMCNIIKGTVISPLLSYAAYKGVDAFTAEVNKGLNDSIEVFKSQRRLIMLQDNDKHGLMDKKDKQGVRNPVAAAKAVQVIDELENGGQAGLPMLGAVSDTVNRPVTVLDSNGNVMMYIGEDKPGEPVFIQYHEGTENRPGHWTGPSNTESSNAGVSENNCLFDAVADQVNKNPDDLRKDVCDTLKTDKHLNLLASGARNIAHLENAKEKYLLMGGYIEYRPGQENAMQIIQNSQGRFSQGKSGAHTAPNHPHGHVLRGNQGPREYGIDSLENYSVNVTDSRFAKTGVMSQDDQAVLTDYVLSSEAGQQAIKNMNAPNTPRDQQLQQKICINVPSDLEISRDMVTWMNSGQTGQGQMDKFEVWIRRPTAEAENSSEFYKPDIFTAFPRK